MKCKLTIFCLLPTVSILVAQTVLANDVVTEREALFNTIKILTLSDLSCDKNEDCAVIGIGNKPCGGPLSYLPYSIKNAKATEIQKEADKLKELDSKDNSDHQRIGTCEAILPPATVCLQNMCRTTKDTPAI